MYLVRYAKKASVFPSHYNRPAFHCFSIIKLSLTHEPKHMFIK